VSVGERRKLFLFLDVFFSTRRIKKQSTKIKKLFLKKKKKGALYYGQGNRQEGGAEGIWKWTSANRTSA
jgi:hypothetical protein